MMAQAPQDAAEEERTLLELLNAPQRQVELEQEAESLRALITQRDAMIGILIANGGDVSEVVAPAEDPTKPIALRVAALREQLLAKDTVLYQAASSADALLATISPDQGAGPSLPEQVERPSWLSAPAEVSADERARDDEAHLRMRFLELKAEEIAAMGGVRHFGAAAWEGAAAPSVPDAGGAEPDMTHESLAVGLKDKVRRPTWLAPAGAERRRASPDKTGVQQSVPQHKQLSVIGGDERGGAGEGGGGWAAVRISTLETDASGRVVASPVTKLGVQPGEGALGPSEGAPSIAATDPLQQGLPGWADAGLKPAEARQLPPLPRAAPGKWRLRTSVNPQSAPFPVSPPPPKSGERTAEGSSTLAATPTAATCEVLSQGAWTGDPAALFVSQPLDTLDLLREHGALLAPWDDSPLNSKPLDPDAKRSQYEKVVPTPAQGRAEAEARVRRLEGIRAADSAIFGGDRLGRERATAEAVLDHLAMRETQISAAAALLALYRAEAEAARDDAATHQQAAKAAREEAAQHAAAAAAAVQAAKEAAEEAAAAPPPPVGAIYGREDHLRALEALAETQAQLSRFHAATATLEVQVAQRDRQLELAAANTAELQEERARLAADVASVRKTLAEAEARALEEARRRGVAEADLEGRVSVLAEELAGAREAAADALRQAGEQTDAAARAEARCAEAERMVEAAERRLGNAKRGLNAQSNASEAQRQELADARAKAAELELLVSEQQGTLDRLIADAMGEVARREKEWLQVRARKDGRVMELEEEVKRLTAATEKAERRAAEFGAQLHEMEDALLGELEAERAARLEDKRRAHETLERVKADMRLRSADLEKRAAEAEARDARQQASISQLLEHKAWLARQVGIGEIVS